MRSTFQVTDGRTRDLISLIGNIDLALGSEQQQALQAISALQGHEKPAPDSRPCRVVDYGCGQGLAGLLLFDRFRDTWAGLAAEVVLIEPSKVALIRAEAVYRSILPHCPIVCVNKRFEDVSEEDLRALRDLDTVHIFSNVLDIDSFDQLELVDKVLAAGTHTFLIVSHDRNTHGGSPRIHELKAYLENPNVRPGLSVTSTGVRQFRCDNPGHSAAICWLVRLEMSNE